MELMPALQQNGIQVDIGRVVRLWLEAKKVPGVDAILASAPPPPPQGAPLEGEAPPEGLPQGPPQGADPAALMQLLTGAGAGGGPPTDAITPDNSGALDPNAYPSVGV